MAKSEIRRDCGAPGLWIDGQPIPACAYMTYFEERNAYADFARAGYRLFTVTVSLAFRPINAATGFTPYLTGMFDDRQHPDFTQADASVERILEACPDAFIFPRVNVAMPLWFAAEHPEAVLPGPDGAPGREALYSDAFRLTARELLEAYIRHVRKAPYAQHIVGYQLAGGNTQEWFHFDLNGGRGPCAEKPFHDYLLRRDPALADRAGLPSPDELPGTGAIEDARLHRYLEFVSVGVAQTILYLAHAVKEAVAGEQIVGVFYGYTLEVCDPLWGTHAMAEVLESPDVDFLCSPNSYAENRALGIDWGDMLAVDSVRLHGKLCFSECDIRTSRSDYMCSCRPGSDPKRMYLQPVWKGPADTQLSVWAVRKAFAHQLTRGSALWWFDMWGGWYADAAHMADMAAYARIVRDADAAHGESAAQTALFVDETLYSRMHAGQACCAAQFAIRRPLGCCGVPYDVFLLSDFEACYRNYRAVIFPIPIDSPVLEKARRLCRAAGIPFLQSTVSRWAFTPAELRGFLVQAGAWCYCRTDDVVYAGRGFLAIHAASAGEKVLRLPRRRRVSPLLPEGPAQVTDTLRLSLAQYETRLFRVQD